MKGKRYIKPVVIAGVLALAGALGYWTLYEQPRRTLEADLEAQVRLNEARERSLRDRGNVRQELRQLGSTTLGASAGEVHPRFRTGLQRIARKTELTDVQINTSEPNDAGRNPIAISKRRIADMPNLRNERDFAIVRGELSGRGSLEQVLRTLALVEAQPWAHRIEGFSIKPESGREKDRFSLSLSVSTMLMPRELAPRDAGEPTIVELDAGASTTWAALAAKNPFREPPPVQRAENPRPPRERPPAPAAPPAYNEWRLTGVVESRIGTEAFMVNTRSEERMAIGTGSSIAGAKLVAAEGERAIFEIDGEEYEVFNGQTLEQRRPTNR